MYKNITFSLDDLLISKARDKAMKEHKTLSSLFKEWILRYLGQDSVRSSYATLMKQLSHARPGRKFTREEMNER